jgi:hypothetical protein
MLSYPGQEVLFHLPTATSALCSSIPALQLSAGRSILGNKRNPASLDVSLYSRYSTIESRFGDSSGHRGIYQVDLGVQSGDPGNHLFINDYVLVRGIKMPRL